MDTAYVFMAINFTGFILSLWRGPFWGLLVYLNIYFNSPRPYINWWASYLPFHNWSFLCTVVLIISIVIHWKDISKTRLHSVKWFIGFLILTVLITFTIAVDQDEAVRHTNILLAYYVTVYCIIRGIKNLNQYRLFILAIVVMAANLSLKAFLYGERTHARLENIGTVDTFGSNEFALLLVGIIPFTLPFLMKGKWYERLICIASLPFLLNAFILCNSRGAFIALILSGMLIFIFFTDKQIRKILLISMICVIPLFLYLTDEYIFERLSSLLHTTEAMTDETELRNISSGRTEIWMYGMKMVEDYPFGAGPNGFKQIARFYMPPEVLTFHHGMEYGIRAAHNTYLQVLVEQGYLGLCIFLIMCFHTMYLLYAAFNKLKTTNIDAFWKCYLFALTLSYTSILVGGLFNSRLYYEFFWWQIALSIVAYSFVTNMDTDISEYSGNIVSLTQDHSKLKGDNITRCTTA